MSWGQIPSLENSMEPCPELIYRPNLPTRNSTSNHTTGVSTPFFQSGAPIDISSKEDKPFQLSPTPATSLESLLSSRTKETIEIQDSDVEDWEDDALEDPTCFFQPKSENLTAMPLRQLVYPRSIYEGYQPPFPICKEGVAVQELREEIPPSADSASTDDGHFEEFLLSDFCIYALPTSTNHAFEMQSLQNLTLFGNSSLMLDGVLSVGESCRYVQGVVFEICSIGGYGSEHHVGSDVWIMSAFNAKTKVYYKLGTPSSEYARYHNGFIWLANLAKNFVDYCHASEVPVSIHNFRSDFSEWALETHKESTNFQSWYSDYGNCDFRHAVCRNIEFLFKESMGVDDDLRSEPIWKELLVQDLEFVKHNPIKESKTIVTPYVYDCFSHLKFGGHLKAVKPTWDITTQQEAVSRSLHCSASAFTSGQVEALSVEPLQISGATNPDIRSKITSIKVGDVIAVPLDDVSKWKDEISPWKQPDTCWHLLVQQIDIGQNGQRSFNGLWLYQPSQTMCAKMKYPHDKELFLSDNCNCGDELYTEDDVLDVISIDWHGKPSASNIGLFVRQTYLENERFVDLQEAHKTCTHLKAKSLRTPQDIKPLYSVGQTVLARPLVHQKSNFQLEVYEITRYVKDSTKNRFKVTLKHLRRRSDFDRQGKPNELVYTSLFDEVSENRIYSECMVRFFDQTMPIPAPYNRGGAANLFYITHERVIDENGVLKLVPLTKYPTSLIQGFDPHGSLPQKGVLRGLDLYCGGGNFGRGLEEGGAVENCYAADLEKAAIHTYNANLRPGSKTKLFYGSVDDLLKAAMDGNPRNIDSVPLPGQIDFISAGSPCQGFSLLNSNKENDKSKKNQSLVASVAAYVDFYRPKYGLLENVVSMTQKGKGRNEDVLSQLICALVGMGYQTQIIFRDAWSSGSPQSRSRLFLCFAAPGMQPLEHPAISHSHPPGTRQRSLGKMANDESFGSRDLDILTPFKFVSIGESAKDLPVIGDGMVGHCIPIPDHIVTDTPTVHIRGRIQAIPIFPRGSNFSSAWCNEATRTMSKEDRLWFPSHRNHEGKIRECVQFGARGWERVHPEKVIGTITVAMQLHSARGGTTIHWNENRTMSLIEYRRAQTYPDEEILVGNRAKCLKIIGNSVARSVAVSFGLKLREAWLKTKPDEIRTGVSCNRQQIALSHRPSILLFSRPVAMSSRAKPIEILDSVESSNDEGNRLKSPDVRKVMGSTLRQSISGPSTEAQPKIEDRVWSLKRPRNVSQDVGALQERVPKAPRQSSQHLASAYARPFTKNNGESSATQNATTSPVPFRRSEMPVSLQSKSKLKIVIDLTSDADEDDEDVLVTQLARTRYKPVNNTQFDPYAQTNQFMHYDLQRKHGPSSR